MEIWLSKQERLIVDPMTEEDLDWVTELEQNTFSLPWPKHAFAEELRLSDRVFVVAKLAQAGEETLINVGYSGMFLSFDEGEITNVAVDGGYRGKGIGQAMLSAQMDMAGKLGVDAFTLEVRVSNAPAIHLYEKLGFESVGVRKNFYQFPVEDAMIMWKR